MRTTHLDRDNGLTVLKGLSGPKPERLKKKVIKVFKHCGLEITIKANLYLVDFLDVTFDLCNITYEEYRKLTNHLAYINKISNNPTKTLKE